MPKPDPYAEFSTPTGNADPYAEFSAPTAMPKIQGIPEGEAPAALPPETDPRQYVKPMSKMQAAAEWWRRQGKAEKDWAVNTAKYAWDVFQKPAAAVGNALATVTGDDDFRFKDNRVLGISGPQTTAQHREAIGGPTAFVTEIAANPLTYITPGATPVGPIGPGLQAMRQAPTIGGKAWGASMGKGAALGGAYAASDPNATPGSVAIGTAAGGALPVTVEPAVNATLRAAGKVPAYFTKAVQELKDLGDRFKINIPAGNLDRGFGKAQDSMNHIPFSGMPAEYEKTRQQAEDAAKGLIEKLRGKFKGQGTASEVARASAAANQKANNEIGHQLYDVVGELAGTTESPRANVLRAIEELNAKQAAGASPNTKLFNQNGTGELDTIWRRLTQTSTEAQRLGETPMDRSYNGMKDLASEMWKKSKEFPQGSPEHAMYVRLSQAARKDMDEFAANSGNPALQGAHQVANTWWRTKVKDYSPDSKEYAAWANSLKGKDLDPEKVMDTFIQSGQDGKARYFYNGLDENGRAAVRFGIVQDAYKKATDGGNKPFSPASFNTYLKNLQDATGVFFKGQDKWELDGLAKVMQALDNISTGQMVHQTGKAAIMPYLAKGQFGAMGASGMAALTGHPDLALGAAASAAMPSLIGKAGTKLMTTPAGKRLLLAASSLGADSPALHLLLTTKLPQIAGVSAGSTKGATPEPNPGDSADGNR